MGGVSEIVAPELLMAVPNVSDGRHRPLLETIELSIPKHKQVKRGLLAKQVKLAGLTEREYLDCFHKRTR